MNAVERGYQATLESRNSKPSLAAAPGLA